MARSRLPKGKADIKGAQLKNPARYKDRAEPRNAGALGAALTSMTKEQKAAWREFAQDLPWLNRSHRALLHLACVWRAKLEKEGDLGVSATQAYSSILSKLGATPADESKVAARSDDNEDPAEKFFH
jgi:hypothetical protein